MGAVLIIVGFIITGIAGGNTTLIVIGTVIRSLGVGPILSAVFALVPDVVQYGDWKYGTRSEGLISSAAVHWFQNWYRYWQCTDGLDSCSVGYNPAAEPTAAVINAVKFDYTWMGAMPRSCNSCYCIIT